MSKKGVKNSIFAQREQLKVAIWIILVVSFLKYPPDTSDISAIAPHGANK